MFIRRQTYNDLVNAQASLGTEVATLKRELGVTMDLFQEYWMSDRNNAVNPYKTRSAQVNEIKNKYQGKSDYGCPMAQRLVNLRVAFSVPNRIFLIKDEVKEGGDDVVKKTKEFLDLFLEVNGLDGSRPRDLAREIELEGQVLVHFEWDDKLKVPVLKYYPKSVVEYTVKAVDRFDLIPELTCEANYTKDEKPLTLDLKDDDFEFIAFNDTLTTFEGYPTCGGILNIIENLDKDMRDWRKLNFLYAHPTPHFKCENGEEAKKINDWIASKGWKIGTALASSGEFKLVGTSGVEANLLMLSIQTAAKIVSGHTGISIHFLGFANVMSNRATAESMGEPTEVVLHSEINAWKAFYTSLFKKAIRMRNSKLNQKLPEDLIIPRMVPLTDRQYSAIKNIYMPAAEKKMLSRETFLNAIPDLDVEAELEKLDEEEKKRAEKHKEFMENNNAGANQSNQPGQGNSEQVNNQNQDQDSGNEQ